MAYRSLEEISHGGRSIAAILADHAKWLAGEGGRRADMRRADMSGADMRGADMRGAYMHGADMRRADMRGAVMSDAVMSDAVGYILGPQRSDGYRVDLTMRDGVWRVVAGCLTSDRLDLDAYEARARSDAHGYDVPAKRAETLAIIAFLRARTEAFDAEGKPL